VLSNARKRWGKEVFVSLFSRVVQQCVAAGLVEGRKIHVDASLVDADANLGSVKPLSAETLKAIEQTAKEQVQKLDEHDQDQDPPLLRDCDYAAVYLYNMNQKHVYRWSKEAGWDTVSVFAIANWQCPFDSIAQGRGRG
jgi:hypothetical protein